MAGFVSIVKKARQGALYVDIPNEVMKRMNLKPFMASRMKVENKSIKIFDFKKTVKIKIEIDEKTLAMAKKIMRIEGYASLDETISKVICEFFEKESKKKTSVVYLYPHGYLQGKYWLIDDYEKSIKKSKKRG